MDLKPSIESLDGGRVRRYQVGRGENAVSYGDAIEGWIEDERFRRHFISLLRDAPFTAYRWETPSITTGTLGRPVEFVLIDAPGLERPPEPVAFDERFGGEGDEPVISFLNLGGDATVRGDLTADGADGRR